MPSRALSDAEIGQRLAQVPGWERRGDRITRSFRFADFSEAFGWMASVALVAERMNHHPEWRNVWARVDVELTTHDAKGLTERDFELAAAMDRLASRGRV
jgi:4a-hydroxytetrahydrobiopterin dehydratase